MTEETKSIDELPVYFITLITGVMVIAHLDLEQRIMYYPYVVDFKEDEARKSLHVSLNPMPTFTKNRALALTPSGAIYFGEAEDEMVENYKSSIVKERSNLVTNVDMSQFNEFLEGAKSG